MLRHIIFGLLGAVATAQRCAMIAITMDESGSMAGEQTWLTDGTINDMYGALELAGIDSMNMLCISGFGNTFVAPRDLGCSVFDSLSVYGDIFAPWVASGGFEDGLAGIQFAIDQANGYLAANEAAIDANCSEVVKMVILVTDEDRDVWDSSVTVETVDASLAAESWIANVVVDLQNLFIDGDPVLGVDVNGAAFVSTGGGAFNATPDGTVTFVDGFGTTEVDYVPLAWDNSGIAWNLNFLRIGGTIADAFSAAFVATKVTEIVVATTPPTTSAPTTSPAPSAAPSAPSAAPSAAPTFVTKPPMM